MNEAMIIKEKNGSDGTIDGMSPGRDIWIVKTLP